jgi:hypothetical protein
MTCEEALQRLVDCLNSRTENPTEEQMAKHLQLCQQLCNCCQMKGHLAEIMQTYYFQEKASPALKAKIMKGLESPC